MKMSTGEIAAEARAAWIEPVASFITDPEVIRWINMAEADFARYTKCLRMKWPFSTTAGQQDYALPIDARLNHILWFTVDGKHIWPTTTDELDAYLSTWRYLAGGPSGVPEWYYVTGMHDEQLGFFKCPDGVYQVVCYYSEDPPTITSISNNTYPKIKETWHDVLVHYVEWRGHRKNRSWELASQSRKDYKELREEAKTSLITLQPERSLMMSGPEYRTPTRKMNWPRWPSNYGVDR